jgi:hypothetical protein
VLAEILSDKQLADLLKHTKPLKTSMQWRFWIALCAILLSIGFVIGLTVALLYMRESAAITFSAYIALGASVASAVISGVGLFQIWDKNRKEEERIPVLEFDGFSL